MKLILEKPSTDGFSFEPNYLPEMQDLSIYCIYLCVRVCPVVSVSLCLACSTASNHNVARMPGTSLVNTGLWQKPSI